MSEHSRTIELTARQLAFVRAQADEVLFGGAAGGGKSFGQVIDALAYAVRYPGSRQLILRRTMPELERTLVHSAQALYPRALYSYNKTSRTGRFVNGSVLEFGYCGSESDVYRYQSAEYDLIRFDELTHFTEHMYLYLISRLRGANGFPKQVKSTTNPGGVGHEWVKRRFIDPGPPDVPFDARPGTRIFLPARLRDNRFLLEQDAGYIERLRSLPQEEQRALLDGEWDILQGRYFTEWSRQIHLIEPFDLPASWRRVFTMDYGLDMLAGYWIACAPQGWAYVYREVYEPGHIISSAARRILSMTREEISAWYAPPDLWNRRQETGRSAAEIFAENGVLLTRASANRVAGWYAMKELLHPCADEQGRRTARLVFFNSCVNAARCIPAIQRDENNPNDCAVQPHELTHAPDAIRYFASGWQGAEGAAESEESRAYRHQLEGLLRYGG